MTPRKVWIAGLVGVAVVSARPPAQAQVPGVPAPIPPIPGAAAAAVPAGAAAPTAVAVASPAAAAAPASLWGFLGISHANCAACKAKLCASPIGQLLNSM